MCLWQTPNYRAHSTACRLHGLALALLVFVASVTGAASAATSSSADILSDNVPRHPLEVQGLLDPDGVLRKLPALIEQATQNKDWYEAALLYLAKANACRVVADWNCQQDAGAQATSVAQLARAPLLEIRGMISDSRGSIATQDFARGEHMLGEAELLLKTHPMPELSADVYLAYSSLSYSLEKHTLAASYAEHGLADLGALPAPMLRARLLRNRARAEAELGNRDAAKATLAQAQQVANRLADPKLNAELLMESARLARLSGDSDAQERNGERVLQLAEQLNNAQMSGLGHEILGLAAIDRKDLDGARKHLKLAQSNFHALGQHREELRVLREWIRINLPEQAVRTDTDGLLARFLDLSEQIEREEHIKASADFDVRLKYAEGKIEVMRLQDVATMAEERALSLAHQDRLNRTLFALICVVALILFAFFVQQRRSNRRLRQVLTQLRDSETLYRTLADYSSDLVVRMRPDGRRLYVSPSAKEMLGYDPEELVNPRWELVHPDDQQRVVDALKSLTRSKVPTQVAYRVRSKAGAYVWIEALARLVPSSDNPAESEIIYSGRDITSRIAAEEALAASQRRLRAVTDNVPALVAHLDAGGRYLFANASFGKLFGIDTQSVIGMHMSELPGEAAWEQMQNHVVAVLRGDRVSFEGETDVRGRHYYFQSNYVPDFAEDGSVRGFFALTFDISALKQAEKELERQARVDGLTGLANRRDFDLRLADAVARSKRKHLSLTLFCVDIDHFKSINDTFGHPVGDAVICEIARRLSRATRECDLVARVGGDEFNVLIEDAESQAAIEVVAQKLVAVLRKPIDTESGRLVATASVGVAYCNTPLSAKNLLALADRALYAAKAAGRDTSRTLTAA